jgi:hypothetical protein
MAETNLNWQCLVTEMSGLDGDQHNGSNGSVMVAKIGR